MSMSTTSQVSEMLPRVLLHPDHGIAGLVDDLLVLCLEHGLQLDWQTNRCRVRSAGGDSNGLVDVPIRKSAFRAILARVAALCNERAPNAVSPYGGQGELSAGANQAAVFRVVFVNTPATQQLELTPPTWPAAEAAHRREVREAYRKLAEKYCVDANAPRPPPGPTGDGSDR
jgi:hypothetical protein